MLNYSYFSEFSRSWRNILSKYNINLHKRIFLGRSEVTFLYTWLDVNVDPLIKPSKINAPHESHLKFVEIILILWSIKTPKICM